MKQKCEFPRDAHSRAVRDYCFQCLLAHCAHSHMRQCPTLMLVISRVANTWRTARIAADILFSVDCWRLIGHV